MKFFLVLLLLLPLSVKAVGVSVSPSAIDLVSPHVSEQKITVENISSEPIVVYIYPDDFTDQISIWPQEFELLPYQVSPVNISADFDSFSQGVKKTNISVISKAKDKKSFNAISGIKIPTTIYISHSYFVWSGAAVFLVVFFGLLIIFTLVQLFMMAFSKKNKKNNWFTVNLLKHHRKKTWYKWW